jgi:putative ABC transport system permease protein
MAKILEIQRPLAWAQLSHQKVRLAVAMGGIAFANVLIFMQLGFRNLFTEGALILPQSIQGDLFLMNPSAEYMGANSFDRIRLYQAAAVDGVADSVPLYINNGVWAYSDKFKSFQCRVLAVNPRTPVFSMASLNQQVRQLNSTNTVVFDRRNKSAFGPIVQQFNSQPPASQPPASQPPIRALLNNRRVEVGGLFDMGTSFFMAEGNVVMSEATYGDIFGSAALAQVSIGVLTLNSGADPEAVKAGIKAAVPGVMALTHAELMTKELQYQDTNPTGPIFNFGVIMGLIVGVVIVYQVLYADVSDHLAEYATLKAMGYSDGELLGVIFQEATILAVLGFIPGVSISVWMYGFLGGLTRLELVMGGEVVITVLLLTIAMCMVSAAIASNKLRAADPADVF